MDAAANEERARLRGRWAGLVHAADEVASMLDYSTDPDERDVLERVERRLRAEAGIALRRVRDVA